jgi:hypothetical protein
MRTIRVANGGWNIRKPALKSGIRFDVKMLFDGLHPLIRICVVGTLSYLAVVALLRYFGKRALSKMNAFDIVITVAVGSCFASAVMTKDITLADGLLLSFSCWCCNVCSPVCRFDWAGSGAT